MTSPDASKYISDFGMCHVCLSSYCREPNNIDQYRFYSSEIWKFSKIYKKKVSLWEYLHIWMLFSWLFILFNTIIRMFINLWGIRKCGVFYCSLPIIYKSYLSIPYVEVIGCIKRENAWIKCKVQNTYI